MAEELRREGVIEFPQARLTAGGRLRAARETAGLSLAELAAETKIPVRMLTLIEAGDYAALPAKAYATGFSRTCARALGLNEAEIVAEVRRELGQTDPAESRHAPTFEPGDPARVPTARFAWLAAVAALAVLAAGLLLWRSYYAPAVTLPPLPEAPAPQAAAPAASVVVPLPAPSAMVPPAPASGAPGAAGATAAPVPVVAAPARAPTPAAAPQRRTAPAAVATPSPAPAHDGAAAAPAAPVGLASPAAPPAVVPRTGPTSTTQ